jgi:nucleoside phosphorylase
MKTIQRAPRKNTEPLVHYGLIASGNQVIKDSHMRNRLSKDLKAFCVEMEAAGLMNKFPMPCNSKNLRLFRLPYLS